ncbi:hypothetical protein THOG11_40201 [Vibrio harveyi]|nr:hypothetical protein TH15OA1_300033 [Vibrio harveyi]CAH1553790.1 hypothetical protein THOD03_190007 [Vibrio harveyi]CAH1577240.1 hypothetical protein THOG11_40201 [Vibrio harveyi]
MKENQNMSHMEKQLASQITSLTKNQQISNEHLLAMVETQNEFYLNTIKEIQEQYQAERRTILNDIVQTNQIMLQEYQASVEALQELSKASDEVSVSTRQQILKLEQRLKLLEMWQNDSAKAISNLVELLKL